MSAPDLPLKVTVFEPAQSKYLTTIAEPSAVTAASKVQIQFSIGTFGTIETIGTQRTLNLEGLNF